MIEWSEKEMLCKNLNNLILLGQVEFMNITIFKLNTIHKHLLMLKEEGVKVIKKVALLIFSAFQYFCKKYFVVG